MTLFMTLTLSFLAGPLIIGSYFLIFHLEGRRNN